MFQVPFGQDERFSEEKNCPSRTVGSDMPICDQWMMGRGTPSTGVICRDRIVPSAKCRTLSAPATAAAHKIPPKRKATGMHIPPTLHSYTALHTQLSLGEHTTTATRTRGDYSKKTTISKWLSPHLTKPNTIFCLSVKQCCLYLFQCSIYPTNSEESINIAMSKVFFASPISVYIFTKMSG